MQHLIEELHFTAFSGSIWRIFPANADPIAAASAPEGRFHHSGQAALYGSLTAEGCAVAIKRYQSGPNPPRLIQRFAGVFTKLIDLRSLPTAVRAQASLVWQEDPRPSPTWVFSDTARARGAHGLLYASRSRPDLTHIVLFAWDHRNVTPDGPSQPWS